MKASIFSRVEPLEDKKVLLSLKKHDEAEYEKFVAGKYDFVVEVSAENKEELKKALLKIKKSTASKRQRRLL